MTHRRPLVLSAKKIASELQPGDTVMVAPRSGLVSAIGDPADYEGDIFVATDESNTYRSDGTSWVRIGTGTPTVDFGDQTAGDVLVGPITGAPDQPAFRPLEATDLANALAVALVPGTNVMITDNMDGTFTIAASGGGGSDMTIDWAQVVNVTGAATITASDVKKDHRCADAGSPADYTITLPTAGLTSGDVFAFTMASGLTKLVTLDATSGHLIDGQQTRVMWANEACTLRWDGADWAKVEGKSIPMVALASLGGVGTQAIPDTTVTLVNVDTATTNLGGMVDTAAHRVIARRAGLYTTYGQNLYNTGVAATRSRADLYKNGTLLASTEVGVAATGYAAPALPATVFVLAAADYLDIRAYQNSGGSVNIFGGGVYCFIGVTEIPTW